MKRPQIVTFEGAVAGGDASPAASLRLTNYDERTNEVVELAEIETFDDPLVGGRGTVRFKTFDSGVAQHVMTVAYTGRVGVRTDFPTRALHVNGDMGANQLIGTSATPAAVLGRGAGTGAVINLTGSDSAGRINISATNSASRTSGDPIVSITFAKAYTAAPSVTLTPANLDAGNVQPPPHVVVTPTGFSIRLSSRNGVLTGGVMYQWAYTVIQ